MAPSLGGVYAVSGLLYEAGCNIVDSQQFGDVLNADSSGLFFMRVHFDAPETLADCDALRALLAPLRQKFGMETQVYALARKPRLLLMVSQHGHCLNDLLFRCDTGQLPAQVVAVVSNHPNFADLCALHRVPFRHLPLAAGAAPAE